MNSRFFIILFFIANSAILNGQFSVEKYLSAPFQDAEIEGLARQMEYLENESFRSPLFRELEVRFRSNDFNLSPEDYRLRLGFINPFERRANKSYNELQADYFETKYEFETNSILANRYKQLIRHYYLKNELKLLHDEINQLKLGHEQLQGSKFSLKLLVSADEKILKKELRKKSITTSVEMLENYFHEVHGLADTIDWEEYEMITVQKIKSTLLNDTLSGSAAFDLALKSFQLDEQSYKIEKTESFNNLGFFQAEYDTDRGNGFNDHMGFQLGINLPVFNIDKPKLQRERLDLIETEYQLQQTKSETEINRFYLNRQLLEHIWSYETVSKRLKNFEEFGKEITYENMEDYMALIAYLSNLRMLKNDLYLQCLNTYIDLIALSGKLSQSPFVNYLSN